MKTLKIYSDGGSCNNGGKDPNKPIFGAYCCLIVNMQNEVQKQFKEMFNNVTNNQMELKGAMIGMQFLTNYAKKHLPNEKLKIIVHSDSQYLIKGCSEWMFGWKKKGWKNSARKVVENLNMWKEIDQLMLNPQLEFEFVWTKGHKGKKVTLLEDPNVYFNEMCDSELSLLLDGVR